MCGEWCWGFFFALERVSDAVYSCVEEELRLFHMEWESAGLIEALNGLSEAIILPTWHVEKLFITELNLIKRLFFKDKVLSKTGHVWRCKHCLMNNVTWIMSVFCSKCIVFFSVVISAAACLCFVFFLITHLCSKHAFQAKIKSFLYNIFYLKN